MDKQLLIGRTGIIREGEYKGWHVKIEPSGEGAFLILLSSNNFLPGGEGYDNWVEEANLEQYFKEAGWTIDWSDLTYDEQKLIKQLEELPKRFRTIFAAACAQRLFSSYGVYDPSGKILDTQAAAQILDGVWSDLLNDSISLSQADGQKCTEMAMVLNDEEGEGTVAEDAIAAIAYTVRYHLGGDQKEVAYPARRETETIDAYLQNILNIDFADPQAEQKLSTHPLMQKVLEWQIWDLLDLKMPALDYTTKTVPEVAVVREKTAKLEIERIRQRAIANGVGMIQWKTASL